MSHYVDLFSGKVFRDTYPFHDRVFVGSFCNAQELQELLNEIAIFSGFKKPRKFIAVIKRFERETKEECIY